MKAFWVSVVVPLHPEDDNLLHKITELFLYGLTMASTVIADVAVSKLVPVVHGTPKNDFILVPSCPPSGFFKSKAATNAVDAPVAIPVVDVLEIFISILKDAGWIDDWKSEFWIVINLAMDIDYAELELLSAVVPTTKLLSGLYKYPLMWLNTDWCRTKEFEFVGLE